MPSIDYQLSDTVTGTLYWCVTSDQDAPLIDSTGGFTGTTLLDGTVTVTSSTGTGTADLTSLSAGTYYLHTYVNVTSGDYDTGRTTETIVIT